MGSLRYTARPAGRGCSPDALVYTLHRADFAAIARTQSRRIGDGIDEATLLRKVHHSLGARACQRCRPEIASIEEIITADADDDETPAFDHIEERKESLDPADFQRWCEAFDICWTHLLDVEICLDDESDCPAATVIRAAR